MRPSFDLFGRNAYRRGHVLSISGEKRMAAAKFGLLIKKFTITAKGKVLTKSVEVFIVTAMLRPSVDLFGQNVYRYGQALTFSAEMFTVTAKC